MSADAPLPLPQLGVCLLGLPARWRGNPRRLSNVLLSVVIGREGQRGRRWALAAGRGYAVEWWRLRRRGCVLACALLLAACGSTQVQMLHPVARASLGTGAGPPSTDAVRNGRYARAVTMSGLRITPPPGLSQAGLGLTWKRAAALFEATSALQGSHSDAVLGYGLVTLTGSQLPPGVPTLHRRPAWVGITWGGTASCPIETAPSGASSALAGPLKQIFTAVVIYAAGGHGAIVYASRGSPICGGPAVGPSVAKAREVLSVPWQQVGPLRSGMVTLHYEAAPCTEAFLTEAGGNASGRVTVTVEVSVPFDPSGCLGRAVRTSRAELFPAPGTPGAPAPPRHVELAHGRTGPMPVLQVSQVAGGPE